jgi:hypothetical protein
VPKAPGRTLRARACRITRRENAVNDFLDMLARARAEHTAEEETVPFTADDVARESYRPEPVPPQFSANLPGVGNLAAELYAELVGVAEIAERLGVRKAQVTNWSHRAPTNGFPAPVHQVTAGRLWRWPDIERWYRGYVPQRQKTKPGRLP